MNYKMLGKLIAQILMVESAFMVPALAICVYDGDSSGVFGFCTSMVLIMLVSFGMYFLCRKAVKRFYAREGLVCVALCWIFMSLFGCLPFVLSDSIPNYIDALFEIVSGFTTTGASILPEVESLSRGILYWRSFSHWLGGMGVLVFLLAIVPVGGQSSGFTMHILKAESPGPNVGKLVPRMGKTAKLLYYMYIFLTVMNFIFLLLGRMPVFDAVCTAFGTAGTGGFGIKNNSIAGYSPYIQNVCTVFMLFFGVNFSCYYLLILKQFKAVLRDTELRTYIGIVIASIVLISFNIRGLYGSLGETIRHAAFQVSSIITTTGFATTDFDLWPNFSKSILLMLMIVGACAGSTGGGLKVGRAILLMKGLRRSIRKMLNPQKVQVVKFNGQNINEKVLENTYAYLCAYAFFIVISFLIVATDGRSITTTISAVFACFNNIGPGFEEVGPTCNFSIFNPVSKLVLIVDMLAGRLELFPILVLLSSSTWKKR